MDIWARLVDVAGSDPDDTRRRRLLNILLVGIGTLLLLATIWVTVFSIAAPEEASQYGNPYPAILVTLASLSVAYLLNHYLSGELAGMIFCMAMTLGAIFSDSPENVVTGGLTFVFTIPILASSFLLRPAASFLMAIITTYLLAALTISVGLVPNIIFSLGFFAVALVAWLSARSLEDALREVRELNAKLDQRVQERTKELAGANEQLKANSRRQTQFFSMVSHELRTPLGIIQGFAEMLVGGIYGEITDAQQEALDSITNGTEQLLELVNDMLDQARLAAGRLSLSPTPVPLTKLVREVYGSVAILADAKGLELSVELTDELPEFIVGDYTRLTQILVNLLSNAIKFTEHGRIMVEIRREDENYWAMAVSDTGPGISAEDQKYIFDPFCQVEGSSLAGTAGSGLGLSIVAHLVDLMEGEVKLESQVGQGSCFTVTLPLQPVEEE